MTDDFQLVFKFSFCVCVCVCLQVCHRPPESSKEQTATHLQQLQVETPSTNHRQVFHASVSASHVICVFLPVFRKAITTLAFSPDGKYVVTGEVSITGDRTDEDMF